MTRHIRKHVWFSQKNDTIGKKRNTSAW